MTAPGASAGRGPEREKEDGDDDEDAVSSQNILRIVDELVRQVDRTKKFVVAMIVVIIISVPVLWHAAPIVLGAPDSFRLVGDFTIIVAILFLVVGIRQWLLLSKWTRRYRAYKERQRKVDEKLDFGSSSNDGA